MESPGGTAAHSQGEPGAIARANQTSYLQRLPPELLLRVFSIVYPDLAKPEDRKELLRLAGDDETVTAVQAAARRLLYERPTLRGFAGVVGRLKAFDQGEIPGHQVKQLQLERQSETWIVKADHRPLLKLFRVEPVISTVIIDTSLLESLPAFKADVPAEMLLRYLRHVEIYCNKGCQRRQEERRHLTSIRDANTADVALWCSQCLMEHAGCLFHLARNATSLKLRNVHLSFKPWRLLATDRMRAQSMHNILPRLESLHLHNCSTGLFPFRRLTEMAGPRLTSFRLTSDASFRACAVDVNWTPAGHGSAGAPDCALRSILHHLFKWKGTLRELELTPYMFRQRLLSNDEQIVHFLALRHLTLNLHLIHDMFHDVYAVLAHVPRYVRKLTFITHSRAYAAALRKLVRRAILDGFPVLELIQVTRFPTSLAGEKETAYEYNMPPNQFNTGRRLRIVSNDPQLLF